MAVAHEGLASLAVDLHEVGDLLALTNSLVQLHNLVTTTKRAIDGMATNGAPVMWCAITIF